ncbi:hypothetical protein MRB53_042389 [Persea americana]|nr:hypothetical protein MRB53_042389 [Persea americana]
MAKSLPDPREYISALRPIPADLITLIVGPNKDKYCVPEQWLRRSPFFASALKREWKADSDRTLLLPDDDSHMVYLYQQWIIYFGKIFVRPSPEMETGRRKEFTGLLKLYMFGEKILDRQFMDDVMKALLSAANTYAEDGYVWLPLPTTSSWPTKERPPNRSCERFWLI